MLAGVGESFCTDCGIDETDNINSKYCTVIEIVEPSATATTSVMITESSYITINYKVVQL